MGGVSIQEVLLPQDGQVIWDLLVYGLLFLSLIAVFMLSAGSMGDTVMIAAVVMFCVLDKTYAWGYIDKPSTVVEGLTPTDCTLFPTACDRYLRVQSHLTHLGTYMMRVLMFALPLVITGQTRIGKARVIAGIIAVYAGIYSAARWYFQQRDAGGSVFGAMIDWWEPQNIFQNSLFILAIGELTYRRYRHRLGSVDGHTQVPIGSVTSRDNIEIEVTERGDMWP
jgi:hypothetical protein